MKRAIILLLLTGCAPACEDAPLAPPSAPPAFVVELTERGSLVGSVDAGPLAPPTSALVLYTAEGAIASDRWLDTRTRWEGARGTFDALDALPWHQVPGRVTLALAEPPALVEIAPESAAARDVALPFGGAPVDWAMVGGEVAVLSRTDGLGTIEPGSEAVRAIGLESLAGEGTLPARVAPFTGTSLAAVGLERPDELPGAVAIVDAESGAASLIELTGLRSCTEVSAMAGAAQVAVLCAGELDRAPSEREEAGLVLLEAGETVRVVVTRTGTAPAPTEALVGMSFGWVAALSRGSEEEPDRLLAVNLLSGARVMLREELWSLRDGPALGEGAFDPDTRELWWPSVQLGIARFRLGDDWETLSALRPPACQRAPARRLRHLP